MSVAVGAVAGIAALGVTIYFAGANAVAAVVACCIAASVLWHIVVEWFRSHQGHYWRVRNDEDFWRSVRLRRAEVRARLREWNDAVDHETQSSFPGRMREQRDRSSLALLTPEQRVELGLELSPEQASMLKTLMPFFSTFGESKAGQPDDS